jgi:hypothetical protein
MEPNQQHFRLYKIESLYFPVNDKYALKVLYIIIRKEKRLNIRYLEMLHSQRVKY